MMVDVENKRRALLQRQATVVSRRSIIDVCHLNSDLDRMEPEATCKHSVRVLVVGIVDVEDKTGDCVELTIIEKRVKITNC